MDTPAPDRPADLFLMLSRTQDVARRNLEHARNAQALRVELCASMRDVIDLRWAVQENSGGPLTWHGEAISPEALAERFVARSKR